MKKRLVSTGLLALLCAPAVAFAQPVPDLPSECTEAGGRGTECRNDTSCEAFPFATRCVEHIAGDADSRRCEIPCNALGGGVARELCDIGETCVDSPSDGNYCKPSRFRVDLNLLDQCIAHFLSDSEPVLGSDNVCSLDRNLNRLLDQDGNDEFDIFDVDKCISAFLRQPGCAGPGDCDDDGLIHCVDDLDCGLGLHCDPDSNACQRECGLIPSRESAFGTLERQCAGRLKLCNYARGSCERVAVEDVEATSCQVDGDCVSGAYCFLGRCAPLCSRGIDCPDSGWYCTTNNRCRPIPPPSTDEGFVFDPLDYQVLFGRKEVIIDEIDDEKTNPLAIIDLQTRKEVLQNPTISFGYRVEVSYRVKQSQQCIGELPPCEDGGPNCDLIDDCLVAPDEAFLVPLNPFGTIFATGGPGISLRFDPVGADRLSPGLYKADVRAIFDNGSDTSFTVSYLKTTPSGEYTGSLNVHLGDPSNALSTTPLSVGMRLLVKDEVVRWDDLLSAENIRGEEELRDITSGQLVHGFIHGNAGLPFTQPGALSRAENEVPIKGIYSPQLGRMRLISVMEIAPDACVSEDGACGRDDTAFEVRNLFGRRIRRVIQFVGPFDTARRRFQGVFREEISGLVADSDLTLDGSFILDQVLPDDDALELDAPLLSDEARAANERVDFPSPEGVLEEIEAEIATWCAGEQGDHFDSQGDYLRYLGGEDFPVFPRLVEFKELLQLSLDALPDSDDEALTIYDYLRGRIVVCEEADADPEPQTEPSPPGCIDEARLRCGLALYRKAALSTEGELPWAPFDGLDDEDIEEIEVGEGGSPTDGGGQLDLFCSDTLPLQTCSLPRDRYPGLATLQEHNRFWRELGQALKFQAGRERSDAFLTLYRNSPDPFERTSAISFKQQKLRRAVKLYDQLVSLFVSTPSTALLFRWPMHAFKTRGNQWLNLMHVITSDRMDVVAELADIERRIFFSSDEQDFIFADHLMQQSYLVQVFLLALQHRWQGEHFLFTGRSNQIFATGQNVLLQLDGSRNPLGISPNQVFFESSDPDETNWHNYRSVLVGDDGDGGLLAAGRDEVSLAIENLRASLADVDTLEARLLEARGAFLGTIRELCGPDEPHPCDVLRAQYDDAESWTEARDCRFEGGGDCGAVFECYGDEFDACDDVISRFEGFTDGINDNGPTCVLEDDLFRVQVGGEERACNRGVMGALLQERAMLNLKRRQTIDDVETVLKQVGEAQAAIADITDSRAQLNTLLTAFDAVGVALRSVISIAEAIFSILDNKAEAPDCIFIVGFSNGTDCPGNLLKVTTKTIAKSVFTAIKTAVAIGLDVMDTVAKDASRNAEHFQALRGDLANLENMKFEIDNMVGAYELLAQEMFDIGLRIADTRFKAQKAADGYAFDVSYLADHLIGRESGSVLLGDQLVAASARSFREILTVTYKMTVAFAHRYNLSAAQRDAKLGEVFQLQTLDEVSSYVAALDRFEREYCGREGIDCDAFNNLEIFRFSIRDELFPELRDVVDAQTGTVITKGQQFHNIITSSAHMRRRARGNQTVDQMELLFEIRLNDVNRPSASGRDWMLSPLECNHVIDGDSSVFGGLLGTVALNVEGQRLGDGDQSLRYELVRDEVDIIRDCHPESVIREIGTDPVIEYPLRRHIVGYAPQSLRAQEENPPSFFTRSTGLLACQNADEVAGELDGGCWRYFARDRSLAGIWRVVIPVRIGGGATDNAWILGEGLPARERPIIEDLVLHIRHRSRPIQDL